MPPAHWRQGTRTGGGSCSSEEASLHPAADPCRGGLQHPPHSLLPQQSKQGKGPCCFRPLKEKEKERAAHPPRLACDKPQKSSAAAKPGD